MRKTKIGAPFWRLWTAAALSNLGDGLLVAALPLIAARLTQDPRLIAGVTVSATLPWLLFTLISGVIIDHVDHGRLMAAVDVARVGIVGMLAAAIALGWATLWMLYAVVFLLGAAETLFDTASQVVVPTVVPVPYLEQANGLLFSAQIATNRFAGPALGGVLFAAAAWAPFGIDAATFAISAVLVLALGSRREVRFDLHSRALLTDLREGISAVMADSAIRSMALGAGVVNLGYTAGTATMVLLASQELGLSDAGFGFLLAAAATGSVLGALAARRVALWLGRSTGLIISIVAIGVGTAMLGISSQTVIAALGLIVAGIAEEIWNVIAVSYRQHMIPAHLLGRVMATYRLIAYGTFPVGAFVGGLLARAFGLRMAPVIGGGIILTFGMLLVPALRRVTELTP